MIPAYIYARYSSDNQKDISIDAQVRACREYADRNGYDIVNVYIDRAQTAKTDNRPAFQEMISACAGRTVRAIIIHKLDRFARNRYDHAIYKKQLKKFGVGVISVLEKLDDSPESIILESVLEGVSEYYSENLARETRKGLKEIALKAKFTGGIPPFGYDVDSDNNYVINELESGAVKQIFQAYLDGTGYAAIIDDFKRRNIKTKFGKPFGKSSFNAILRNKKYAGIYEYYPVGTYRQKISEPIIVEDAIPAIIDKATFWEVQKIMDARQRTGKFKAVEPFLLSGILYCDECGSAFYGHRRTKNGKHYYAYECSKKNNHRTCNMRSFSRDKLEDIVCDFVKKLLSPAALDEVKKYMKENQSFINGQNSARQEEIAREIASLDRKINNTADLLIETPSAALKEKLLSFESQKQQLEIESSKLEVSVLTDEKIDEYMLHVKDFDAMSRKEKKMYIAKCIEKITLDKDGNIKIQTTYNKVVCKDGGATQI